MQATLRVLERSVALAVVLALLGSLTLADDVEVRQSLDAQATALAEAGRPGPAHAKLEPLAGSWTYTHKLWMDPKGPPMESRGTIERKWVLGGRFLEEKVIGTGFDGSRFDGFGLLGYDNAQQKYTSTWACSMGTGTHTGLGTCNAAGTTLTFQTETFCPVERKTVLGREELRIESNDKVVAESYVVQNGEETKVMELVAIRKK